MIIRTAQFEDEERISKLIAQFRVELKELKGIKSSVNIEQAKEEFREYMEAEFPIFVAENSNNELVGYLVCRNLLNLIEIRRPLENEVLTQKISIGKYEYNY